MPPFNKSLVPATVETNKSLGYYKRIYGNFICRYLMELTLTELTKWHVFPLQKKKTFFGNC